MRDTAPGRRDDAEVGLTAPSGRSTAPTSAESTPRPRRSYHAGRWRHVENAAMCAVVRTGLVPHTYVLTSVGRKTGRARHNPVTLVERDGRRWLVAPYGPVSWVLNVRAAGSVTLARRRGKRRYTVRELSAVEAAPVLKQYLRRTARVTWPYFEASPDSPVRDFAAEATLHPVFELMPAGAAGAD